MRTQALALGMDRFQLTKSTKFSSIYPGYGSVDILEPSSKFVSSSHRFERDSIELTPTTYPLRAHPKNKLLFDLVKSRNDITPLCEIGNKGLYIDARGRLFPCCWVANRYNHNSEWQQLADKFNLHNNILENVLVDEFWEKEFQTFRWHECKTKCASSIVDFDYATTW